MCLLHLLPLELVVQIFSLACTDTGQTGCSLGLVCRAFWGICLSTGVDLQVVSLRKLQRVRIFLDVLRRREESVRKIQSLMLVERGRLDPEGDPTTPGERCEFLSGCLAISTCCTDLREISQTVSQIMTTVSPDHLRILAVYLPFWCNAGDAPALLPVNLPHLDELIL